MAKSRSFSIISRLITDIKGLKDFGSNPEFHRGMIYGLLTAYTSTGHITVDEKKDLLYMAYPTEGVFQP